MSRSSAFLSFASIATCLALAWPAHSASRESWQPPDEIMDAVDVRPGMRIGEAGAGEGYLTFPLAERVGARGIVYANDISARSLETVRSRAEREGVQNLRTVMGEVADPLFPETDLDMVIMVYVLHCLEKPLEFLESARKYLKPGAPLVIIEKNTHQDRAHYPAFMSNRQILETIQQTSFELAETHTFLPRDTIYVFTDRENDPVKP